MNPERARNEDLTIHDVQPIGLLRGSPARVRLVSDREESGSCAVIRWFRPFLMGNDIANSK